MMKSPPRFFLRFFRWFCHPRLLKYIEGDLMELYDERVKESGKRKADVEFVIDVLLLFRPGIINPESTMLNNLNHYDMLKNYVKVGIRNILRYKAFSFINIFGLAVAMSVSMLIILMLVDQTSYDQFHKNKDRIYRVNMKPVNFHLYATSPFPAADALKTAYPFIEETTSLLGGVGGDAVYGQKLVSAIGYFASDSFLRMFSYELESGDRSTALHEPNTMILSHDAARQLFGDEDPLGKVVEFTDRGISYHSDDERPPVSWGSFKVTGVMTTNYKSHLKFDVLVSAASLSVLYKDKKVDDISDNWNHYWRCYTYVMLKPDAGTDQLNAALNQLAEQQYKADENMRGSTFVAQSLNAITPGPALGNSPTTSLPTFVYYILGGLALVILIFACLNYTNLSIARAVTRSKEIGIRKVNGAFRWDLIFQFLSESIITALMALAMANVLLLFLKSAFMHLWVNKYLNIQLEFNTYAYLLFFGFALVVGFIAGVFPALSLSKYKPAKVLKNMASSGGRKLGLRKVLTVTQFAISLLLIITAIVIYNQFNYFMHFEYGFMPQQVVNVKLQSNNFQLVKNTLSTVPGVTAVSGCSYVPAIGRNDNATLKKPGMEDPITAIDMRVDEDFIDVMSLDLIAGHNLPPGNDSTATYILVNEQFVKEAGFNQPEEILGYRFEQGNDHTVEVAGVIKDFTFHLLFTGRKTGPIIMHNEPQQFSLANVKIESKNSAAILAQLKDKWKTVDPVHPFEYEFYDDELANTNQGIFDIASIIGFVAFLAITIACLGLLGMAIYTIERRTKEVGIRKVMGAGETALVVLLSREFLILLGIAIFIAAPLGYFVNNLWLQFLVNRVDIDFSTIALGSFVLLVLGFITIGSQTIRASKSNPADILKME